MAKEENPTFDLNQGYFNLSKTITDTFETLKFISESRNVTTNLSVSQQDLQFFDQIYGDQNQFQQIFLNLFSNSLKFTQYGGNLNVYLKVIQIRNY